MHLQAGCTPNAAVDPGLIADVASDLNRIGGAPPVRTTRRDHRFCYAPPHAIDELAFRRWRTRVTCQEMGRAVHYSAGTYGRYEADRTMPNAVYHAAIAYIEDVERALLRRLLTIHGAPEPRT